MPLKDNVARAQYARTRWQQLKASGVCVDCRKASPLVGKIRCAACTEYRRTVWAKTAGKERERRRALNLCNDCTAPAVTGLRLCQTCRDRRKQLWKERHAERLKPKRKQLHQQLRLEVFAAYGGAVCVCCGETHVEFLSINHINNDGADHRKQMWKKIKTGGNIYGYLKARSFPPGFNVMCMNCNFSVGHHGYCPHTLVKVH